MMIKIDGLFLGPEGGRIIGSRSWTRVGAWAVRATKARLDVSVVDWDAQYEPTRLGG
jgi:hypothetical protein